MFGYLIVLVVEMWARSWAAAGKVFDTSTPAKAQDAAETCAAYAERLPSIYAVYGMLSPLAKQFVQFVASGCGL